LVVRERRTVGPVELPGTTELGLAQLWFDAPQLSGCGVVIGNAASLVGLVDRDR